MRHLLLVGAYRDNEVSPSHPLMRTLEAIREAGGQVQEIVLAPLGLDDVGRLVADALHCERERARPLASWCTRRPAAIRSSRSSSSPRWPRRGCSRSTRTRRPGTGTSTAIRAKGFTDNVVDLMAAKLSRLPAAHAGGTETARLPGQQSPRSRRWLWFTAKTEEAIARGTLGSRPRRARLPLGRHLHIPARPRPGGGLCAHPRRASGRRRICGSADCSRSRTAPDELEENIFEIVNQFDRGAALITTPEEREQVAELNLMAGKRAKASTAYASALHYFAAGRALLAEDGWERRYHAHLRARVPPGRVRVSDRRAGRGGRTALGAVAPRRKPSSTSPPSPACASISTRPWTRATAPSRWAWTISGALASSGRRTRRTRKSAQEYERMWQQLGAGSIEALLDLPLMSDPDSVRDHGRARPNRCRRRLFTDRICSASSSVAWRISAWSMATATDRASPMCWLGMLLGPHFGDYQAGFRFGKLGLDLVEKRGLVRFKARVYLVSRHVIPWTQAPCETGLALVRRAFEAAQETGDLTFAAYCCGDLITHLLAIGDPLGEVQREAENGLEFVQKSAVWCSSSTTITGQLGLIRTLRGLTPAFGSPSTMRSSTRVSLNSIWRAIRAWLLRRMPVLDPQVASAFLRRRLRVRRCGRIESERLLWKSPSLLAYVEVGRIPFLWRARPSGGMCDLPRPTSGARISTPSAHHRQIALWAENCPENFATAHAWSAPRSRAWKAGNWMRCGSTKRPSGSAREHGFIQNEGIANELAARFYAARDLTRLPTPICGMPGPAISAGAPTARSANWIKPIRICDSNHPRRTPIERLGPGRALGSRHRSESLAEQRRSLSISSYENGVVAGLDFRRLEMTRIGRCRSGGLRGNILRCKC